MSYRQSTGGTILDEILDHKEGEIEAAKGAVSPEAMAARADASEHTPRGFRRALLESPRPAVIAELKRRSPSKGLIREDFEPSGLAQAYAAGGAACLSVLTDEKYFGGELGFLEKVRGVVDLPLLRKEFVIDPYQIDEARAAGADCILLIAGALTDEGMAALQAHGHARGLDVLIEVHDEEELARTLAVRPTLLGVNNRDLKTFETDLATTERLAAQLPEPPLRPSGTPGGADRGGIALVAESGIGSPADVARLESAGACAFLVGESLMRQPDVTRALANLRGIS